MLDLCGAILAEALLVAPLAETGRIEVTKGLSGADLVRRVEVLACLLQPTLGQGVQWVVHVSLSLVSGARIPEVAVWVADSRKLPLLLIPSLLCLLDGLVLRSSNVLFVQLFVCQLGVVLVLLNRLSQCASTGGARHRTRRLHGALRRGRCLRRRRGGRGCGDRFRTEARAANSPSAPSGERRRDGHPREAHHAPHGTQGSARLRLLARARSRASAKGGGPRMGGGAMRSRAATAGDEGLGDEEATTEGQAQGRGAGDH
mmetsp:Transcript_28188/g.70824  ORF Transcript_28188/g.70824 Transcript_28188/m.70824 type:complete len:259 (-) Transcript_28188:112-888(-)